MSTGSSSACSTCRIDGIAAGREDALVAVLPLHAIVLVLGASEDVEDLACAAGFPEPMAVHDHEIAHPCAWSLRHAISFPLACPGSPGAPRRASGLPLTPSPRFAADPAWRSMTDDGVRVPLARLCLEVSAWAPELVRTQDTSAKRARKASSSARASQFRTRCGAAARRQARRGHSGFPCCGRGFAPAPRHREPLSNRTQVSQCRPRFHSG